MQNHHEKARDMARSVLPSTARRWARSEKARIHRAERARTRAQLHTLRQLGDPDEYEGDLSSEPNNELAHMVSERRAADKIGPLVTWATRTVETSTELATAPLGDRLDYFRRILPPGVIGDHAITHLRFPLDPTWPRHWYRHRASPAPEPTLTEMLGVIVASAAHGELNRRIGRQLAPFVRTSVAVPAARLIDDEHPAPGIIVPRHTVEVVQRRNRRFLAGAHDIAAFAEHEGYVESRIARNLYHELVRVRQVL